MPQNIFCLLKNKQDVPYDDTHVYIILVRPDLSELYLKSYINRSPLFVIIILTKFDVLKHTQNITFKNEDLKSEQPVLTWSK